MMSPFFRSTEPRAFSLLQRATPPTQTWSYAEALDVIEAQQRADDTLTPRLGKPTEWRVAHRLARELFSDPALRQRSAALGGMTPLAEDLLFNPHASLRLEGFHGRAIQLAPAVIADWRKRIVSALSAAILKRRRLDRFHAALVGALVARGLSAAAAQRAALLVRLTRPNAERVALVGIEQQQAALSVGLEHVALSRHDNLDPLIARHGGGVNHALAPTLDGGGPVSRELLSPQRATELIDALRASVEAWGMGALEEERARTQQFAAHARATWAGVQNMVDTHTRMVVRELFALTQLDPALVAPLDVALYAVETDTPYCVYPTCLRALHRSVTINAMTPFELALRGQTNKHGLGFTPLINNSLQRPLRCGKCGGLVCVDHAVQQVGASELVGVLSTPTQPSEGLYNVQYSIRCLTCALSESDTLPGSGLLS